MSYGVTAEGFISKTLAIIQDEVDEALKSTFGAYINTLPQSIFGQLKGIFSERESLIWELAEAVYNSQYPDTAEGTSLDNVSAIIGLTRLSAVASTIVGQALFGTLGTVIPAGTVFSVAGNMDVKFSTDDEVTLIAGTDEVQTITFSATPDSGSITFVFKTETTAAIAYDDAASDLQDALNALDSLSAVTVSGSFAAGFVVTFAGADGKQEQPALAEGTNTLLNGATPVTITVTETTPGVYQGQANCTATETGPLVANAETVTVIDNPIAGLTSVFNPEDAVTGRDLETDAEFRIRRNNRLQISLAGPLEAIISAILELNDDETEPELTVTVFENYTNTTDAMGLPAKSFEAFVYQAGGVTTRDQEIADAIFAAKPAGIEAHGDVSKTVTDSQGFDHTIKFSRPTEVDIYLELDLTVTSDYPVDGDTVLKATLVEWGNALGVGEDIIVYPSLIAQLMAVDGITDVVIRIGTAASPTLDDNIDIDDGTGGDVELSRWDTSRITIAHI